jgi:N-acetylglucosamine kinase-like BadF-type ATPase
MEYVLGVDGGNTKTIALIASSDGTIIGSGRSGQTDIYGATSPAAAVEAVASAVNYALQTAGIPPTALVASCFSLAGADWPEDFDFWREMLSGRGYHQQVAVVNDAIGALYAGLPNGPGVVVACGTGATTGARGQDGRLWHSSFWQATQGSHHLGQKALRAIYQAELGIAPATTLTGRILTFFELSTVEEVLHRQTAREQRPPGHFEGLARILLDEGEAGDAVARQIIEQHGASLGDYALAAARHVGIESSPYTLVLTGGVLRHPSLPLREAIVNRVRTASPGAQAVTSQFEPVVGALLLSFERAGFRLNETLFGRLQASLPPAALFVT